MKGDVLGVLVCILILGFGFISAGDNQSDADVTVVTNVTEGYIPVQVFYVANFTAHSLSSGDTWISKIAGGKNKEINVLYGIVGIDSNYFEDGEVYGYLAFHEIIKITGKGGSYDIIGGTDAINSSQNILVSKFSSASLGNAYVQEGGALMQGGSSSGTINLIRKFDSENNLIDISILIKEKSESELIEASYSIEMNTLNQFGDSYSYIDGDWWVPRQATLVSRIAPLNLSSSYYG